MSTVPNYSSLDANKIQQTIATLRERIHERFPGAGLTNVCGRLLEISEAAAQRSKEMARPMYGIRLLSASLIALIVGLCVDIPWLFPAHNEKIDWVEFVALLEPAMNIVVLVGAIVFFFASLEIRHKRGKALKAIHELRSVAHIIDMHQLTKDPEALRRRLPDTKTSPQRCMDAHQLQRYLDYSSEMLSLTGKIAALYIQGFDDPVAIASVNEVEELCTGLSRKIWQKIMILHDA